MQKRKNNRRTNEGRRGTGGRAVGSKNRTAESFRGLSGSTLTIPEIDSGVETQIQSHGASDCLFSLISEIDSRTDQKAETIHDMLKSWVSAHYPVNKGKDDFCMNLNICGKDEAQEFDLDIDKEQCIFAFDLQGPVNCVIGNKIESIENSLPGLGQYILRLLSECPLGIYTFQSALYYLIEREYEGSEDERERLEAEGPGSGLEETIIKRKDFDAEIPKWASAPSKKVYRKPTPFDDFIIPLRDANARYLRYSDAADRPYIDSGMDSILLYWKQIEGSIMQQIIDDEAEPIQNSSGVTCSPAWFAFGCKDFKYPRFVNLLEAYMDASTAAMKLLSELNRPSRLVDVFANERN